MWCNLKECLHLNDAFAGFLIVLRVFLQRLCNLSLVGSKTWLLMIILTHNKWSSFTKEPQSSISILKL